MTRRRKIVATVIAVAALAAAYSCWPRHADLTGFDPATMARLETAMWRHYYEKRYLPLLADLYDVARRQVRGGRVLGAHGHGGGIRVDPAILLIEREATVPF